MKISRMRAGWAAGAGRLHQDQHAQLVSDVQRKHFRGLRAFISHQVLQCLQWNPGIQRVHGVAVTECMRGDRHGECHAVSCRGLNCFIQPSAYGSVRNCLQTNFFGLAGSRISSFQWNPERGDYYLQLSDELWIG